MNISLSLECEIKCKGKLTFPAEINSKLIEFEGELALNSSYSEILLNVNNLKAEYWIP